MNNSTILAVNDDADQLELAAFIFRESGYRVLTADGAVEGLEIARRDAPDLIISDVSMPDINGIEFCRRIRADKQCRSIPFLLVSAICKDTENVVGGLAAGADDYIEAPFEPLRVVAKVAQLIERSRMANEVRRSEERYRNFIEQSTEGICRIEFKVPISTAASIDETLESVARHGYYAECNDRMARMYGLASARDLTGKYCRELSNFSEIGNREFFGAFVENGYRLNDVESREFDAADGDKYFINNFVGIVDDGKLVGVWAIRRDVTESTAAAEVERASRARLEKQNAVLDELTKRRKLFHVPVRAAVREITEITARVLETERVGVWLYNDDKSRLKALDVFVSSLNSHSEANELNRADYPLYFAALAKNEPIVCGDVRADARTVELTERYFPPRGITSTLDVPIRFGGQVVGVLCHEHVGRAHRWRVDEQNFVASMAGLVALLLEASERRQAETALRESREYLEVAQQAALIGSFNYDFQKRLLTCSPSMEFLYGAPPGSLNGNIERWLKYIHPEDLPRIRRELTQITSGVEYKSEYRILTDDGEARWIVSKGKIFFGDAGEALRVIGVNIDITERKQNELTLGFQKTLLKAQSEASIDGVLVVSPTREVISYNRRFVEMWEMPGEVLATGCGVAFLEPLTEKLVEPQQFFDTVDYFHKHPSLGGQAEISLKDGRVFERHSAPVMDGDEAHFGRIWSFHDITTRRLTEEKLRESEKRYRLLFESNPLPMWVYDVETLCFLAVNDAAIRHYGYSREEFLALTIKDIRPAQDVPKLIESVSQPQGKFGALGSWRHIKKNGELIDVEITLHELIFDERHAHLVLADDVTERRKAEESIRFQAHLLNTVEQSVIAIDLDGTVVYWNRFAQHLYGWTAAEAVGRRAADLITSKADSGQAAEIMKRLHAGNGWSGEFPVQNKSGASFPAYVSNSPINDADGKLIGFVGVSIDITERKKAEEAVRQAEARYRNLVELSPAIVYLAEPFPPYSPIYVSPNVEAFGYPASEWFERDDMWLSLIHEEDRARVLAATESAMSQNLETETEYRIVGRGGEIFWVHDKGCFISDERGDKVGWQGVILDVTETKKLEEQLRQSQKLKSVGQLAGGIAHDFNNMLTAINGYSDLTLRRLKPDDPLRANIEEIKKAGERSAQLTHQLLAFSRKQVLKPEILNLNAVIIDISKMLNRLIGEHINLELVSDSKLGMVEADPGQLAQVIMNLAVNARDAMPAGGNLTIETANVYLDQEYAEHHFPTEVGFYVAVSITDTGTGIAEETKQHIFEPFYTTKEIGRGTGLGLSTVYGIVKQSGGYIWVDSEIGKGTTFRIYLPRVEELKETAAEDKPSEAVRRGTETILLVEDEEIVRKMSRQMLEAVGYRVLEAANGIEALAICDAQPDAVHLLLTDVVMPQMSGRKLAEKLAQTHPHIRLLYMSGYTDDAVMREETIKEGKNFIQKPFTLEALAEKIRKLLD